MRYRFIILLSALALSRAGGAAPWFAQEPAAPTTRAEAAKLHGVNWYGEQLALLRAQIEDTSRQIAALREFRATAKGASNAIAIDKGNTGITPEDGIRLFEERKKSLEARRDALEDQAHRDGIAGGELERAADRAAAEAAAAPPARPGVPEAEAASPLARAARLDDFLAARLEKTEEGFWRRRFSQARERLRLAEHELDILQRELNLMGVQYYDDPNKALREQYTRRNIDAQRQAISDKKNDVQKLRLRLEDLEDDLHRSRNPPGWSRE